MRTSRPRHAPVRPRSTRPARATALVALGTVALVGAAPAAAIAADEAAPEPAPADAGTDALALPAEVQEDQVVLPSQDATPAPEAPSAAEPTSPAEPAAPADAADAPAAGPAAVDPAAQASTADPVAGPAVSAADPASSDLTPDPAADPALHPAADPDAEPADELLVEDPEVPVEEPCVTLESCFGTGKWVPGPAVMTAGVTAADGAPLAGAVLEIDVVGTTPEPEWTGTTDASGDVAGGYQLAPFASATVRIVSAPEGAMLTGVTSQSFGPCSVPFLSGGMCTYHFDAEVAAAYRVLDLSVVTTSGEPVEGATFELWGPPASLPVTDLALRTAAAPAPLAHLATATSGAAGRLTFGPVAPGGYELRATHVPAGLQLPVGAIPLTVAAVGTVAEADVALVVPVSLLAAPAPVVTPPVAEPAPVVVPVAAPVEVVAPAAPTAAPARPSAPVRSAALAATGAEPAGLVAVAAAFLALGAAATAAARRVSRRA
ncbi:prealbumin-like fold domain-containing protein [Actinotalea solisilvae]|uniref:prealbumin-like fold domain-containing protein n=1 Tax=Actinotalea solisilvae TaxID=2072922 RepID=UPI0018F13C6F|nr:prealbumin-like fold domain-containing protein [Actinotalea solisilvae]